MTGETFYWLLNMSLIASAAGLIILPLRAIKKIPRRVTAFLWVVPFVRAVVPFGLGSRFSLLSLVSLFTERAEPAYPLTDSAEFSMTNVIRAAESYDPVTYKLEAVGRVFSVAAVVWLSVASAILIALAIVYSVTVKEMRDARVGEDGIYYSDKISSPAVYGIIKPKIVLPSSLEGGDNRYILSHEKAHIRRADNAVRIVAFAVAAVHWFNPLSWVFLKLFLSDLELACDEKALKGYSADERREYARALLDCAGGKSLFASAFGGARVKTRIENVLSYKKMTAVAAVCFGAMIAAVLFVLLTNAR